MRNHLRSEDVDKVETAIETVDRVLNALCPNIARSTGSASLTRARKVNVAPKKRKSNDRVK